MKNLSRRSRGFTLAELLIVVAVIAVLTAIAIPVYSAQMERGREATDTANIRSQYAEVMVKATETGDDVNADGGEFDKIPLTQQKGDWQNDANADSLGSIASIQGSGPAPGGSAWVSYTNTVGAVIHFSGAEVEGDPTAQPTTEPLTPEQAAHKQNNDNAGYIGSRLVQMMTDAGVGSSAKVTLKVHADGSYEIDIKHCNDGVTKSKIEGMLDGAGLLSDGKVAFAAGDNEFKNGYRVQINWNGSGKEIKPKIESL